MIKKIRFGIGSFSLLLTAIGIAWAFSFRGICIGDIVLDFIGINAWSNGNSGTHYTVYYSLAFFIPAFLLGLKRKNDFGAKVGMVISAIIGAFIILSTFFLVTI